MKYYCATEVKYLKSIVNPLGRKPTVYTRTRRNNTPITTIRRNLLSTVQEPDFSKEEALELALEVKNRKSCWNCETCIMIEITEEGE